MLTLFSI